MKKQTKVSMAGNLKKKNRGGPGKLPKHTYGGHVAFGMNGVFKEGQFEQIFGKKG